MSSRGSADLVQCDTLLDLVRERAGELGDQVVYRYLASGDVEGRIETLTYAELELRARAIGAMLADAGASGQRVLLLYPSGLEFITAFMGCLFAGAVAVPAYPPDPARLDRTLPRLRAIARDCDPLIVLTQSDILSIAEAMFSEAPELATRRWLASDGPIEGLASAWKRPDVSGRSLAFLQYTSGSTGVPRGVMLSHANVLENERLIGRGFRHEASSIGVGWLPLFHDMGLIGNVIQPLFHAFSCVLMSPVAFLQRPSRWLAAISHYRGTASGGPNFAYDLCVRRVTEQERAALDLRSWTVAFNGAEPVRMETLNRFADRFAGSGFRREAFYPCYGLAESTLFVTGAEGERAPLSLTVDGAALEAGRVDAAGAEEPGARALTGVGQAGSGHEVRIVNPATCAPCAPDSVGEIWVSGPSVGAGYWDRAEENDRTFRARIEGSAEGTWLRTGDLGFFRDGSLFVTGRLKDLIIIRGRNHYPQDLELTAERSHPSLRQGCTAAFSVEAGGEEKLVVVTELDARPGSADLDPASILGAIRQTISEGHGLEVHAIALLRPRTIPKTSSGKIQRHACRVGFLAGSLDEIERQVSTDRVSEENTDDGLSALGSLREALESAPPGQRQPLLERWLRRRAAGLAGVVSERIELQTSLAGLGLDSIGLVELLAWIEQALGRPVPRAWLWEHPSIAALAARLLDESASPPPSGPGHDGEAVPLRAGGGDLTISSGQLRMWLLDRLVPESALYNVHFAIDMEGPLAVDALRRSLDALAARHTALRTVFIEEDGRPRPELLPARPLDLPVADLRALSEDERSHAVEQLWERGREVFDLAKGPLMRVHLAVVGEARHMLFLTQHHIVTDGWSVGVLAAELAALYGAFSTGHGSPLGPMALQYSDYARWQSARVPELEAERAYWAKQLARLPRLELPTDRPRPSQPSHRGESHAFSLPAELVEQLASLARQEECTLFVALLSGWATLLHRYSGQDDFGIGTVTAGRERPELRRLVGYVANTLVARCDFSDAPTFRELLRRTRATIAGALAHAELPFDEAAEAARAPGNSDNRALFQVAFSFQNLLPIALDVPDARWSPHRKTLDGALEGTSKFDLTLLLTEANGKLEGAIEYSTDLFAADRAARMAGHLEQLLRGAVACADEPVARLPLMTEAETEVVVVTWNDTTVELPRDALAHRLFEEQAALRPDATALVLQDDTLTYGALNARANQLARHLRRLGVGPEARVGLCAGRSMDLVVGLLGILKAGGTYVPLDPQYPIDRLAFMMDDAQISVLLTQDRLVDDLPAGQSLVFCLDTDWPTIARLDTGNVDSDVLPEHAAYVIYTSGSTGKPKGVVGLHRGLVNLALAQARMFDVRSGTRVLQFVRFVFDVSLGEVFMTLGVGGTLYLAPEESRLPGPELIALLRDREIEVASIPPPVLASLADEPLPRLRSLITGGEATQPDVVRRWGSGRRFFNSYGPTETTISATISECRPDGGPLSIGRPIANTRVYVLDRSLQPTPVGVPGELYIGGVGVTRGYLGRPGLSAERFVPDPFSSEPGARLYRTGDLISWRSDHQLEFLGRADGQIKLRGFRIELGEIEAALASHPDVRQSAVVVREDTPGDRKLIAYVVAFDPAHPPTPSALREHSKRIVPDYMIPSAFVVLDALPRTSNDKVDRQALPAPDARPEGAIEAPRTEGEARLARIFRAVLRLDEVDIHDNFFEVGGDSILSIQVVARARAAGLRISPRMLFQHPTIAELAAAAGPVEEARLEQGPVTGEVPLTPVQRWFFEAHRVRPSHFNQAVLLETLQPIDVAALEQALQAIVVHHDALRLRFITSASGIQQRHADPEGAVVVSRFDLAGEPEAEQRAALDAHAAEVQASMDLAAGPLVRAALFEMGAGRAGRLLIAAHHLVVDGVSWRILLEDLALAYASRLSGEAVALPPKTTSFQEWARRLSEHARSPAVAQELSTWLSQPFAEVVKIPRDHEGRRNLVADAGTVSFSLSPEHTTALLQRVPHVYHTQVNELLLAALWLSLSAFTGAGAVLIDLEGHGREDILEGLDLSRTVGWFTAAFPLVLRMEGPASPRDVLLHVKETLRRLPSHGLGHGLLRYLGDEASAAPLRALPRAEVSFNYLGRFDTVLAGSTLFQSAREPSGPAQHGQDPRLHLLEVTGIIVGDSLEIGFTFARTIHEQATIDALVQGFAGHLDALITHCLSPEAGGYSPSDFPLSGLDQRALDHLTCGRRDIEDIYPLAPMQQGMFFHTLRDPRSGVYVEQLQCVLEGDLDSAAFEEAWQQIADRHPSLRTSFHWEGLPAPLQIVRRRAPLPFEHADWRDVPEDERRRRFASYLAQDRADGFDLTRAPLMRLRITRVEERAFVLLWTHHHILLDGWSLARVLEEVFVVYDARSGGQAPSLPAVIPYRRYHEWLTRRDPAPSTEFFQRMLAGFAAPTPLRLPQRSKKSDALPRTCDVEVQLSAGATALIAAAARRHHLTLNTLVQGAWALVLGRYSGERDVVYGVTVAGRPAELQGADAMVGLFINTLPMRVTCRPDEPALAWLERLQADLMDMRQHEAMPLIEAQRLSDVPRGQALFETIVVFENYPLHDTMRAGRSGLTARDVRAIEQTNYGLTATAAPGKELSLMLSFDSGRFEEGAVRGMVEHWRGALEALAAQPERPLATVPMLSEEERIRVLALWKKAPATVAHQRNVPALFTDQAARAPGATAVVFEGQSITYAALHAQALALAAHLHTLGVGPDVRVGLCVERSLAMVVGALGILLAGGAYVPLDPDYPADRLAFMLEDARAAVLVTQAKLSSRLTAHAGRVVLLDELDALPSKGSPALPAVAPDNLAYVVYTSGSTGRPKGVMVSHGALASAYRAWEHEYSLDADLCHLQMASFSFDVFSGDLVRALCSGGRLVICPQDTLLEANRLEALLRNEGINTGDFAPAVLRNLVRHLGEQGRQLDFMRLLVVGSDVWSARDQEELKRLCGPATRIVHAYGVSEATIDSSYHVESSLDPELDTVPIGRPFPGTELYVLDLDGEPTPPGIPGELYIGGEGLARGYLDRPDLTAERFVPHPFSREPGRRLYRTGDLARSSADGELEFLGRVDHQVKVRGFRVELGEIESVLETNPAVREAIAVVREDAPGDRRIVAYVVPASDDAPAVAALREHLQRALPAHMVPSAFVLMAALPLTPNGKLDRRALPAPEASASGEMGRHTQPRSAVERELHAIWKTVLRVDELGVDDNFFEVGGDSILTIQIVSRAAQAGLSISPRQLFEHPTIAELAGVTGKIRKIDAEQGLVTGSAPLTPIQRWFFEQPWPAHHHYNQAVLLVALEPLDLARLERALSALETHHDALRMRFRPSPSGIEPTHVAPGTSVRVDRIDLSHLSDQPQEVLLEALAARATEVQGSLDLEQGPLMRAAWFHLGVAGDRLLLVVHHLVVDGVSWRILLEHLQIAYQRLAAGETVQLPPKTTSFQRWSELLANHARSPSLGDELQLWTAQPWADVRRLPRDHEGTTPTNASLETVTMRLTAAETQALLQRVPQAYHSQVNDVLLTVLGGELQDWSGGEAVLIDVEGHGREELFDAVDLVQTMGWFTSVFPVVLRMSPSAGPAASLKAVKEQLRRIPARGIGYGLLRYLRDEETSAALAALPAAEISFNYLGQFDDTIASAGMFRPAPEPSGRTQDGRGRAAYMLELNGMVAEGRLRLEWTFSPLVHERATIDALSARFSARLRALIAHCLSPEAGGYTPSDFPLTRLAQDELDSVVGNGRDVEDVYRLSSTQHGMLFHTLRDPSSGVYCEQISCLLDGDLDESAFVDAWQRLLDRHATLRTSFHWEGLSEPVQIVHRQTSMSIDRRDWRGISTEAQQQSLDTYLAEDRRRGFDLTRAPLVRALLARVDDGAHRFVLTQHHLLSDGWSLPLLLEDLFTHYSALHRGVSPQRGRERPYRDYIAWLQRQDTAKAEGYFRSLLRNFGAPTPLHVEKISGDPGAAEVEVKLDAAKTAALQATARRHRLTLNTLVQGAWALLLHRYSGERDVVFGVTVSGRPADLEGADSMVGMFINTLPLRIAIAPEEALLPWLERIQTQLMEMRQYEHMPLVQVQSFSDVPRGQPLFDTIVVFENYPLDESLHAGPAGLGVRDLISVQQSNFPITTSIVPGRELTLKITYDTGRFDEATAARMLGHFEQLLGSVMEAFGRPLGTLSMLTPSEQERTVRTWNETAVALPPGLLHELVARHAAQTPDALAVKAGAESLSHGELDRRANQLAHHLRSLGVGPDVRVGVHLERGVAMVVAFVAILKAGGAYVPLDPTYPKDRLAFMIDDARAPVVLTEERLRPNLASKTGRILCLDTDAETIARHPTHAPSVTVRPDNLIYVIYTSGSTGRPKGVENRHDGLANLAWWVVREFGLGPSDRVAQRASMGFDACALELWPALLAGGSIHLVDEETRMSPDLLVAWLLREGITITHIPPAVAEPLVEGAIPEGFSLHTLLTGSDKVQRAPQRSLPFRYINLYGPTETSILATWAPLLPTSDVEPPPIGKPLPNVAVYVLDRDMEPVPVGVPGELHIGGAALGRGYSFRPALTAEKFVPDPFSTTPGARLYRTGDLARYRADGNIDFLGRIDDQVKLRGYRIELGEIEALLHAHPAVAHGVVAIREDVPGEKRLVAYLVAVEGSSVSATALREHLQASLPEYMVPSAFVSLDALPLTPNGKVDRKALPAPDGSRPDLESAFVAPRTAGEAALAEIWKDVLRVDRVGVHDNFFEVGGDSILSIQIVTRAAQAGLKLSPKQIFEHPTIEELAAVATTAVAPSRTHDIAQGPAPLTPIQRWFFEQALPNPHHFNQAVLLHASGAVDPALVERALAAVVAHHDALRFQLVGERPDVQQPRRSGEEAPRLLRLDLSGIPEDQLGIAVEARAAEVQADLDLASGRLLRAAWLDPGEGRDARLLLVIHHLVVDNVSWRILLEDLEVAYRQIAMGVEPALPARTTSFQRWAELLSEHARADVTRAELTFWEEQASRAVPALPRDHADTDNGVESAQTVTLSLSPEETDALLHRAPRAYRTRVDELLLAALTQTLVHFAGGDAARIDLEGHGREDLFEGVDLTRTVGWFTTIAPAVLTWAGGEPAAMIKSIKEQCRRIPRRGIGHGLLRYLADEATTTRAQTWPRADVSFNYLGQHDSAQEASGLLRLADEPSGPVQDPRGRRAYLLEVSGLVAGGRLALSWTFGSKIHERATIEDLAARFLENLQALITHTLSPGASGFTPSDFPLAVLDQQALDRVADIVGDIEDIYALSPMQQGMLYHTVREPDAGMYCEQLTCTIAGKIDEATFARAWQAAVDAHPALRSSFHWDHASSPVQITHRHAPIMVDNADWRRLDEGTQQARLADHLATDRRRGFDIARAPLMRVLLAATSENEHTMVWTHHHLLLDGWSLPLLLEDVFKAYDALGKGAAPLVARGRPYRDYIAWLGRQDISKSAAFFREHFQGFSAPTKLALDRPRGTLSGSREVEVTLSVETTAALTAFARRHGLTLNTLAQGAWALLLGRYSGQRDVVFGVTVAGRPATLEGVESMIGLFINTLPLRVRMPPDTALLPWLLRLQGSHVQMREHEHVPLVAIQEFAGFPRGEAMFESIVVFENYPLDEALTKSRTDVAIKNARLLEGVTSGLALAVVPGNELELKLVFDASRYEASAMSQLIVHLCTLLERIPTSAAHPLGTLSMLTPSEQERTVRTWNETAVALPPGLLHELVARHAAQTPDALAVKAGAESLSHGELDRRANQLAHHLRSLGVGPDVRVGVHLERGVAMVVAFVAILKAGGAYVPLDPTYPKDRLAFMIDDARAPVVLTEERLRPNLASKTGRILCLDTDAETIARHPTHAPSVTVRPDNLIYVIYTSGSTGRPKGVENRHDGLANLAWWVVREFGLGPSDRVAQRASMGFDACALELWPALLAGGSIHLVDEETRMSPDLLVAWLLREGITITHIPPAVAEPLVEGAIPEGFSLHTLLTGSDKVQRAPQRSLPFRYINLYGPTETSILATWAPLLPTSDVEPPPIGKPLPNVAVYVLDRDMEPVPVGVPGELHIGGAALGRGYSFRPALTAEKFVPDPFSTTPGARLYRTGDLARYRADGNIDFLGRIDDQVKLRGYRIELGEIEALLHAHPAVAHGVVAIREDVPGDKRLVAYFVSTEGSSASVTALREHLQASLPEYMVPSAFVSLDALPLTPNGKVDRKALPASDGSRPDLESAFVAPRNNVEQVLAEIFGEVLNVARVGVHDNFFALGGHSLLATQVVSRIRVAFQVELPLRALFEAATVAELARGIETMKAGDGDPDDVEEGEL